LRFGRAFGGNGRVALCCHLVELLRSHHPFVVQSLHAGVTLLHHLATGLGLLPHLVGAAFLFLARPLVGFPALCGGGIFGRLGLGEFCIHLRRLENGQGVAGVHLLSFFDQDAFHATGHFARHAILRHFSLSLNHFGLRAKCVETADGGDDNDRHDEQNGGDIIGSLFLHCVWCCFDSVRS
jgi:hypothetical protein